MRCLCEARGCRGFIGGTGESSALESSEVEDPADASHDPEPIMLEVRAFPPPCPAVGPWSGGPALHASSLSRTVPQSVLHTVHSNRAVSFVSMQSSNVKCVSSVPRRHGC